jgi:hypothetical protein
MTALDIDSPLIDASEEVTGRAPNRRRDFGPFDAIVAASPRDPGFVRALVLRPERERRLVVEEAVLDVAQGVIGDNWLARGSKSTQDGRANPESQLTLMSTRVLAAIEPDASRWPLAGDQLLVDFDLSIAFLPAGSRLWVGEAELVVTETPHTGCAKLSARFGSDALRWINGPVGRDGRYRGANARVIRGGIVRLCDEIRLA